MARRVVAEVFDTKRPRTIITPTILPTGIYTYEVRYSPIIGPDGNSKAVLSLPFDITERLESEQKIRTLAFYDDLTGLPNRALFLERLDGALHSARQHERTVALLFIDLDHFKRVNDTLGHGVGDRLLTEVAERLRSSVRACDTVARAEAEGQSSISRLGGDEFTILLTEISSPVDAAEVAERILEALSEPVLLDEHEVFLNASIGIAVFPDDATDAETLLRNADTAMYAAKGRGRNRYRFYASSMDESASRNLYLDGRLRGALERDEFRLCYDDFGTGYSSLSDLRRFPIQRLKIDRSFVGGVTTHPDDAALTFAIIAMARSLHLDVVAEGVETPEQAAFLREHGCGALQDFLFSRAVAAEEFERFLERAKPLESDLTLDLE